MNEKTLRKKTGIKICGLQELEHVQAAIHAGATHVGFVFAPSRRFVTKDQGAVLAHAAVHVERVGVFVNPTLTELQEILTEVPLSVVQLHGEESPEFCQEVRKQLPNSIKIWKAFAVKGPEVVTDMQRYLDYVDGFLLDSYHPQERGGTGNVFSWDTLPLLHELVKKSKHEIPLWVAGGLTSDNVSDLLNQHAVDGVDVSSGVEVNQRKSIDQIHKFIEEVKGK